ncbi:hypothetical protein L596_030709 [Steinernema carpocapsae]|uniref:Abnormal cell migration protein 18-like fibronectin type I domain-containing protein n=1 Tax=Steinernema carpocapsae TaxID=34508 RepID=A0A4U5LNI7_STECR|nr:hypothetical protein L596_030709 [Steinernema carpocapsae]
MNPLHLVVFATVVILSQADIIPTVDNCKPGKEYLINHIVFNCTADTPLIKSYRPVGCSPSNLRNGKKLGIGLTYKGFGFLYSCHRALNTSVEYVPIKCLLDEVEMEPGMQLRRQNTEYSCIKTRDGDVKLKQSVLLHKYCKPNESADSRKQCAGQSVYFIHADYGYGSTLTVDNLRELVKTA